MYGCVQHHTVGDYTNIISKLKESRESGDAASEQAHVMWAGRKTMAKYDNIASQLEGERWQNTQPQSEGEKPREASGERDSAIALLRGVK